MSNRETLERAMREGLPVKSPHHPATFVAAIGLDMWVASNRQGWHSIEGTAWQIVEPEVTADDLADAILETIKIVPKPNFVAMPALAHYYEVGVALSKAQDLIDLAKRYKQQQGESK